MDGCIKLYIVCAKYRQDIALILYHRNHPSSYRHRVVFTESGVAWRVYEALKQYYDTFEYFRPQTTYREHVMRWSDGHLMSTNKCELFEWDTLLSLALRNDQHFRDLNKIQILTSFRETPLLLSPWELKWSSRLTKWYPTCYDIPIKESNISTQCQAMQKSCDRHTSIKDPLKKT